jgi:hypothetical protein
MRQFFGLSQPTAPNGQMIIFSAGANETALDSLSPTWRADIRFGRDRPIAAAGESAMMRRGFGSECS